MRWQPDQTAVVDQTRVQVPHHCCWAQRRDGVVLQQIIEHCTDVTENVLQIDAGKGFYLHPNLVYKLEGEAETSPFFTTLTRQDNLPLDQPETEMREPLVPQPHNLLQINRIFD